MRGLCRGLRHGLRRGSRNGLHCVAQGRNRSLTISMGRGCERHKQMCKPQYITLRRDVCDTCKFLHKFSPKAVVPIHVRNRCKIMGDVSLNLQSPPLPPPSPSMLTTGREVYPYALLSAVIADYEDGGWITPSTTTMRSGGPASGCSSPSLL